MTGEKYDVGNKRRPINGRTEICYEDAMRELGGPALVSHAALASDLVTAGMAEALSGYGHTSGDDLATWLLANYDVAYREV